MVWPKKEQEHLYTKITNRWLEAVFSLFQCLRKTATGNYNCHNFYVHSILNGPSKRFLLKFINYRLKWKPTVRAGSCIHWAYFPEDRQHKSFSSTPYTWNKQQTEVHPKPIWKLGLQQTHKLDFPWIWRVWNNTTINCTDSVLQFSMLLWIFS